jgi:hypothetical protein
MMVAGIYLMDRRMIWIFVIFVDFPVIYAYDPLLRYFSIPVLPAGSVVFGGLEWVLVGIVLDMTLRNYVRKRGLRGTKHLTNQWS